jgi:hypothetical protein
MNKYNFVTNKNKLRQVKFLESKELGILEREINNLLRTLAESHQLINVQFTYNVDPQNNPKYIALVVPEV